MLVTEDLGRQEKIKRQIHFPSQMLLPGQTEEKMTHDDLVNCEAAIIFLEEMVQWLETMLELKKKTISSHLTKVEKRVNVLSFDFLEISKKELDQAINVWGKRPFEDYIHEK
jgi:hypothetical protein